VRIMIINTSNYSVSEILNMIERRELIINKDYQRGSGLWPIGAASYFIDTILEMYPFPKVYMYEFIDRPHRILKKELVDGQQRITTIARYCNNDFAITGESKYSGMRFRELDEDVQDRFMAYLVSVDVIRSATRPEILQMFRRMNAYTVPLNPAERRHSSYQGAFKWFVNELSDRLNEFFTEFHVFSDRQIVRMADAELITDCVVAIERGIVSSASSDLTKVYEKYDADFPLTQEYGEKIRSAFSFIGEELGILRGTNMMKTYALHSLVTALIFARFGGLNISGEFQPQPIGRFTSDTELAKERLLALSQAHEAKEIDGPYERYVWGCEESTTKAPRRYARVASILRALGVAVPDPAYANLF
jgi:hypothetical protein